MKHKLFLFSLIILQLNVFAQQKKYATKTIGGFVLEKFPLHYLVTPAKTEKETDKKTGKLISYSEYNKFGQLDGLSVIMRSDGKFPEVAVYKYKGETVYTATYFPNTNIAEIVTSNNVNHSNDGYHIHRTLRKSGGYTEEIKKFEDNKLIEINGVKETGSVLNFKDSLLDGNFKYEFGFKKIEGEATAGKLKRIRQYYDYDKTHPFEIIFREDSFVFREPSESIVGKFYDETYKLVSMPLVTNSKNKCLGIANFNGFPYLIITDKFEIKSLRLILEQEFPPILLSKQMFKDSLLNGYFQYREYITNNGFYHSTYKDVTGNSINGKLISLNSIQYVINTYDNSINSKTETKYNFTDTKVEITETNLLKQIILNTYTKDIINNISLTNSKINGGYFDYLTNNYNNIDEALDLPLNRNKEISNNKSGFYYYNSFYFNVDRFIDYIRVK